jgi:hypothetical protein
VIVLFRVNFLYHLGTLRCVNTLHVATTGGAPSPQNVADEINTHLQATFRNLLATTYTWDSIDVQTVTDPNNPAEVPVGYSKPIALAGARVVSNSDLPPRICGMATWRTGAVGRSFRGRFFGPPLESTTQVVGDVITAAGTYTPALNAFAARVVEANLASGSTWSSLWLDTWHGKFVVYSPTRHRQALDPYYRDITSYSNTTRLAYLSSRDL